MFRFVPLLLLGLAGCTSLNGPAVWPFGLSSSGGTTAAYSQQRGRVELIVKSGFPGILDEISTGSGPVLAQAMQAAGIPAQDQAARVTQLQGDLGLYGANPGALVTALMLYGR